MLSSAGVSGAGENVELVNVELVNVVFVIHEVEDVLCLGGVLLASEGTKTLYELFREREGVGDFCSLSRTSSSSRSMRENVLSGWTATTCLRFRDGGRGFEEGRLVIGEFVAELSAEGG